MSGWGRVVAVLRITEVINPYNGQTVDIQLDRSPIVGGGDTFKVYASRVPDDYGEECVAVPTPTENRFRVRTPYPVPDGTAPELLYFTVYDVEGYSVHRDTADAACPDGIGNLIGQASAWVGHTREDELTDVMKALWRRIVDNKNGIESRLRAIEPSITLKQIIWGMGERIDNYPAIEINQVALSEPYEGAHRFRIAKVEAELFGYIVHQVPTIESELVTAFGRAVQRILNQEAYEQMDLVGGHSLAMCMAETLSFDNNVWDGGLKRFVSSWSLSWRGEYGESIP